MDTIIHVRITDDFKERADEYARKAAIARGGSVDKALSAYVREALAEKMARDAARDEREGLGGGAAAKSKTKAKAARKKK